jgi:tRNA-2-methylthio-N6-dimethylallyladenosine synthase
LPVLAAHVHMPVQSGSNRILKRMIRRYTREEYLDRISRLRGAVPGLTLSSDFIVGFPGETDADFEETLALVAEAGFTSLFAFKYSPRPFTPALKLGDDVTEEKKNERLQRLLAQVEAQQSAHLSAVVGTDVSVLVEGLSKTAADGTVTSYQGRTSRNEIVHIPDCGRALIGEIVRVHVTEAFRHSLRGDIHPLEVSRLAPKSSERRTKRSLALVPAPTAG